MRPPAVTVVDFETMPIQARPAYPPVPVGVSIKTPQDKKARYYAWGHPTENNCSKRDAARALHQVWRADPPLLFHNAKFDRDVAETHMDCPALPWHRYHDTMFLLFLSDPHAPDLGLKPAGERLLGLAPEEQDDLKAWILAHRADIPFEFKPKDWGAAIGFAPGGLTGRYANGDVDRTYGLFKKLYPEIISRGMGEAYDRERELLPILLENERVGMRVDVAELRRDIGIYTTALEAADVWLRRRLKNSALNLDNDGEIADALSSAGIVDDSAWSLTATGKRSVSKNALRPADYNDPRVASAFGYRNRLSTCLKMFMLPWERQASARRDAHISTNWNQVRQARENFAGGTRTGRPSTSDPNFLNISKTWDDKNDDYAHPAFLKGSPPLPLVRRYVLPDKGETFCHRDYNGQELRILGHYEDGALLEAYKENPRMDVHAHVKELILDITGLDYHRTQVKITNFRRIYGGGAPATAGALNIDMDAAKRLLVAHGKALPGVEQLKRQITAIAKGGDPIVTWGGREYYVEPPKYDKKHKRFMDYYYKLLNYLIQGSAADATKQAIINYIKHPARTGRFLVTVYDELNASARKVAHEMQVLRESMEGLAFDVPMLTDGKTGPNWAAIRKYEDTNA